jgi:nucleotide sugar dehydrogenase
VIGLGKMGLPVAVYYADRGASVVGIDIHRRVVDAVNEGRSPIGPEPGVDAQLPEMVRNGQLRATSSYRDGLGDADVVIVLVPLTAHGGTPDLDNLDAAVKAMAPNLKDGAIVIFETTLPVGTTSQRFTPVLRESNPNVNVAFSPERVSSGRVWRDLAAYPKIVGAVDDRSLSMAVDFYNTYLDTEVRPVGSAETAEMIKLAETTYRDINIAFANELARFSDEWGIDVTTVIDAANSQPYSHIHRPGVGVGGHCIPHYPYLLENSTSGSKLVREARRINEGMPVWVLDRLEAEIGDLQGRIILILGVAYRAGVREVASSPAFDLATELERRGAKLVVSDPLYSEEEIEQLGLTAWAGEEPSALILVTDHAEYRSFPFEDYPPMCIVDGRNVWDRSTVERAGHSYIGVGR